MITVKLILDSQRSSSSSSSSRSNWTENDFNNLKVINLNYKKINKIDNLELFNEINELNLKGNQIKLIENIEFLYQLKYLDLSDNLIESDELIKDKFPASLETLILSGNPCTKDQKAINDLKNSFPNLQLITDPIENEYITLSDTIKKQDSFHLIQNNNNNNNIEIGSNTTNSNINTDKSLLSPPISDSEAILREVVERKCRLQSLATFDIEMLTKELDSEYEKVLSHTHNSLLKKEGKYLIQKISEPETNESHFDEKLEDNNPKNLRKVESFSKYSYQSRINDLKSNHEASLHDDFIQKLRNKALADRERLFHPNDEH